MKALVYDAKQNIAIQDMPEPSPSKGQVKIKVKYAGICGSDMAAWHGGITRITKPVILSHEFVGEIVEVNQPVKDLKPGDRVVVEPLISCGKCEACKSGHYHVCRVLGLYGLDADGGFAKYVCVASDKVTVIPDELSFERVALIEPLAVAVHMVRRSKMQLGDVVAIYGAGPIGMLVAMVARKAGASKIVLSDINPYRLNMAKELGFEVIDARDAQPADYLAAYGAEGCDVAFEAAATSQTMNNAINFTKPRGTVLNGGLYKKDPTVCLQNALYKEIDLIGSRVYNFKDYDAALDLLKQDNMPVEALVSRILPLDELIEKGFYAIQNQEPVMKILARLED
ncbi:MAG: zinc-dependent alcohol dehydrogenase [Christensenellales bacterium]